MMEILALLIGFHFVCDYVLQTDTVAKGKNRHIDKCLYGVNWYYWLTTHAVTHGLAVGIITGNLYLGLLETFLHWLIDFGKCEKRYNLHIDQLFHIICKLAYLWFLL